MKTGQGVFRSLAVCAAIAGVSVLFPTTVQATVVAGGVTLLAPGEADPVGGTQLATTTVPISAITFSGSLTSTVISGDTSNGLGGLTFTYLLTNDAESQDPIERLTVSDFASFVTDMSYQTPAGGTVPTFANRTATGEVVGFSFVDPAVGFGTIPPGGSSALLVIQTDAESYVPTLASVINGSVAMANSFAPTAIPEPGTLSLLGLGAIGLLARRRRTA